MARGKSGRVVLEIDPMLKKDLYTVLADRGETMKDWFVREARSLVYEHTQPSLLQNRFSVDSEASDSE